MNSAAKIGWFFLCWVLFLSCNTYNNFRAYYNTYYNAKKSFKTGLEKVQDQSIQINPAQFISIYPSYPAAGGQHFVEAIDNATQILGRFPESKWTDNALLLIGKAYFYQHKYYPALQKFEAVLNLPQTDLMPEAVLWKSRVLFEKGLHRAGTQFMREQIQEKAQRWNINQKAIATTQLAAHLAMIGKVEAAGNRLRKSIPHLKETDLIGRSYFLLGLLYLRAKKNDKAFQSFTNVERYNPVYPLSYYAELKSAQAASMGDRLTLAEIIYNQMLTDDKNRQWYARITYELGKTVEQKGEFNKAKQLYQQALRQSRRNKRLSAKIYYSIAELIGKYFKNYSRAAAYYDSSRAIPLYKEVRISTDTRAYGRYITLKAKISQIDSLLWLSTLRPAALDSVILAKQRQVEKHQKKSMLKNNQGNIAENRYRAGRLKTGESYATAFGFLNYQNRTLVAQASLAFKNVWGNRPLGDNWRHSETARIVTATNKDVEPVTEPVPAVGKTTERFGFYAKIPFTPEQKKATREQKYFLQYQLATLFFLTLNKPDSAAFYYKTAVQKSDNWKLVARGLYSLHQVYKMEGQLLKANDYKNMILTKYPHSIYAGRLRKGAIRQADAEVTLRQKTYHILSDSLLTGLEQAKKLEQLALRYRTSDLAANIYYRSIRNYIKAAKSQSHAIGNTLASKKPRSKKYAGPYWQKVRDMLALFQKMFPEAEQNKQVKVWQGMLN